MSDFEPLLEDSIQIAASPAQVWSQVSDVRRMVDWSPQVKSVRLKDTDEVALGTRFTNLNEHLNEQGELEWATHAEVVRFEPERAVAFRVAENYLVWTLELSAADGGTLLTQRREAPEGLSQGSADWTDEYLGGQAAFTASQRAGMRQTLEAIKASVEGA